MADDKNGRDKQARDEERRQAAKVCRANGYRIRSDEGLGI